MIKQILQFITGMEMGDYPDDYTLEDLMVDVIVSGLVVYSVWDLSAWIA